MNEDVKVTASKGHELAIGAVVSLLAKFKVDCAFVGQVAESAWLDKPVEKGSVDVLAVIGPDRRQQIPMMAMAHDRCFQVDKDAVEAARELDLIPMSYSAESRTIPIHILFASNALYSIMIRDAVETTMGDQPLKVVRAEDLALLLVVDESEEAVGKVKSIVEKSGASFDVDGFNERLASLGLSSRQLEP